MHVSRLLAIAFTAGLVSWGAPASAQSATPASGTAPQNAQGGTSQGSTTQGQTASTQTSDDDDAKLIPAEPDYRLVNLPTTLRLPEHKMDFELTHRFNGNLRNGSFSDQASSLFGLDDGASIGIELRYAPIRHVQAIFFRTNIDRIIEFQGKYDAVHQNDSMPVSITAVGSIEGANNFHQDYAPSLGAVVSRMVSDRVAVYANPTWVHNTAAGTGVTQDTGFLGLGGRYRFSRHGSVVAELTPRLGGYKPGDTEYRLRHRGTRRRPPVPVELHEHAGDDHRAARARRVPQLALSGVQPGQEIFLRHPGCQGPTAPAFTVSGSQRSTVRMVSTRRGR